MQKPDASTSSEPVSEASAVSTFSTSANHTSSSASRDSRISAGVKPSLRGVPDLIGLVLALPAVWILIHRAQPGRATAAMSIYGGSVLLLLGASALYHIPMWPTTTRMWLRRLDHAAIFVLIGGTYTPFSMLVLDPAAGVLLLWGVWSLAAGAVLVSFVWASPPRWLLAGFCVALGWSIIPYTPALAAALGGFDLALILGGGVVYSLGALAYVRRWPNPLPNVFGYHEFFHVLVVLALGLHYLVIFSVLE